MKKITVKFLLERMKKAKENDKEWRTKAAEYVRKHKDEVMTERRPASCKYIQGGETHIYLKCPHCGHVYEPEKGLREYTCPECGVLQDIDDPYKHGLPLYQFTIRNRTGQMIGTGNAVILLEASDRFLTGVYADCLCMYFPDKPNSPEGIGLDGHEEITAEEIKPAFYFAWSRDTGFRTMEGNKDTLSVKRRHIEHLLQLGKYRDQFYCENDYTFIDDNRQDWKTLFGTEQSTFWDAVSELYEKEREQTKKKEMPMTKRQRLIEMYKNYQPEQEQPSVDPWTVVGSVAGGNLICKVEDQFSGQTTMMIACPECRKFRKIMVKGEDILACPSCGKVISRFKAAELGIRDNDTADTMLTTVELTPKGAVLFRTWRVKVTCDFESQTFKENAEEQERLFYDKTGIYWFTHPFGEKDRWEKTKLPRYEKTWINTHKAWTQEELTERVKNSVIPYSGLDIALNDRPVFNVPGKSAYERMWYKDYRIELFLKAGLFDRNLFTPSSAVEFLKSVPKDKTSLLDILQINSRELAFAKRGELVWEEAFYAIRLMREDPHLTEEDVTLLLSIGNGRIGSLALYGILPSRAVAYLKNVRDHQCIEYQEVMTVWTDYLNMAQALGYDLEDKSRKFPSSLKKAHDVASFAYKFVKEQNDEKIFEKRMETNRHYQDAKDGTYTVLLPKKPEDIVEEGTKLHHCVASYVRRVTDGDTLIAFVRKKEEPDIPFVTMEIKDGTIPQIYGAFDRKPQEDVLRYVRDYSRRKGLVAKF